MVEGSTYSGLGRVLPNGNPSLADSATSSMPIVKARSTATMILASAPRRRRRPAVGLPQPSLLRNGRPTAGRRRRRGALANIMVAVDLALTIGMLEVAESARLGLPFGNTLPKPEYRSE